jgi:outer membrane protein OmpA-like peptidoglycan-associated protein
MSNRYRCALLVLLVTLGILPSLDAQPVVRPEDLTNRQLAYPGDPSAVGWNPSLLGVKPGAYGALLALPYSSSFSTSGDRFGAFAKIGPAGVGALRGRSERGSAFTQFYAGFGWAALRERFWVGGALRLLDDDGTFKSGGIVLSGTLRPASKLIASLTLINPTSTNDENAALDLAAAYFLSPRLTLLAGARYDNADSLAGEGTFGTSLGVSAAVTTQLNLNGHYAFNSGTLRIGAEFAFGGATVGNSTAFVDGKGFQGGVAFARYALKDDNPESYAIPADALPPVAGTTSTLGWAPSRAYVPEGLEYRKPTNDAQVAPDSYRALCDSSASRLDAPEELLGTIARTGGPYAALADTLKRLSPDPARLYGAIRQEYYSPQIQRSALHRTDTLPLVSRQGYSIGIQSIDQSAFPLVSAIIQVANEGGRNVAGLGAEDFRFRDTSLKILSVRPIDRKLHVPVDIVLLIDCSGSMMQKITAVRANVENFVNNIESRGADYHIGGVLYGSIIYDTLHPTGDFGTFRDFFSKAAAIGGDEISSLALKAASQMRFRANAQRVFILITDDYPIQENARLNEADLTRLLWSTGARLYSIITPCRDNSAIMTRLSLGSEYDIRKPFNSILDQIGTDITTIYRLVYRANPDDTSRATAIIGHVLDENGAGVEADVKIENAATLEPVATLRSDSSGRYTVVLPELGRYRITASRSDFIPTPVEVDASHIGKGAQLLQDLKITSIDAAIASGTWFRLSNIFFDFDRWELKSESIPELEKLVALLDEYPVIRLEIGAHTDSQGTDEYNQALSEYRAEAVVDFLIGRGIAASRLDAHGYGKSLPIATNVTDEGRALNRRVEFRLVR